MIKVCSIDPSTKKSGIALYIDGKLKRYGLINASTEKDLEQRMLGMCVQILDFLNEHTPNIVYVEEAWSNGNTATTKKLMLIIGCIYGWCAYNKAEFISIMPSQWRKWCGMNIGKLKRKELKEESKEFVKVMYDVEVSEDEADAIAIGYGAIKYFSEQDNG